MEQLNAHQYEGIYEELGIDLNKLGCVMVDLEPFDSEAMMAAMLAVGDDFYLTNDNDKPWIDGFSLQSKPHITLLYGLMENAHKYEPYIADVMQGWNLEHLEVDHIGYFESPYEDDPYYCIVAHIKLTAELLEGHARLSLLPHIDTYSSYLPHLTIAYIKKDEMARDRVIDYFTSTLGPGKLLAVKPNLNLGYEDDNT